MRLDRVARAVALCLTAAGLAACGAPGTATPPAPQTQPLAGHPSWWREAPETARAGVYVAQANGSSDGVVFGYGPHNKANKAPSCSITGQTFGETQIAADPKGRLYLPNVATDAIAVYAPHCGALLRTIPDPSGSDVAVAAVDGSLFAAAGGTHVSVCRNGTCSRKLTDDSIFQIESVAVDHLGNVWASYYNQGFAVSLIVWPNGSMPGRVVKGYVNENTPGGLSFDIHDNLVSIQSRFNHVYVYECAAGVANCINTGTFALKAASVFGSLDAKSTNYQVTDYANNSVDVYRYPDFTYEYSYDRGLRSGYSVEGIVQTR